MSEFTDWLHAKRDGQALSESVIAKLVDAVTAGRFTDAQLGAFTMAVCYQGMSTEEQVALTLAMRDSGTTLQWSDLNGPVVDKHSTGGVGDMVSLMLGPMLAACGAYVPMISGRGLGHTGGTLDKLESIPGFEVFPALENFRKAVREVGVAIVGQTDDLAPADRRMYAVRDETSTIPSIPLIVSSILSKKFAEGLDGLVLDVKAGNGAFMRNLAEARPLARQLVDVSRRAGLRCSALITDMNQPLAWSAGNALEVREAVEFMTGRRHPRLEQVTLALGAAALQGAGLADDRDSALRACVKALASGEVAERFGRMVAHQGGPTDLVHHIDKYLPNAPVTRPLLSRQAGWIGAYDTRGVGLVVMYLGGGRQQLTDKIDHRVGLSGLCSVGERIEQGMPLVTIHAANESDWDRAARALLQSLQITETAAPAFPGVLERFD